MKFVVIAVIGLLLNFVNSRKGHQDNDYTKGINKERSKFGLDPIVRNEFVEKEIFDYNSDPNWYYTNGDQYQTYNYATGNYKRWKGDHIPDYMISEGHTNLTGWKFLWRDRTNRSIKYIHSFRIKQRDCFDLESCSDLFFNGSISCLKPQSYSLITPYKKCSWAYNYYPKMIERNFTEIACVKLGRPPPNLNPIFNKEDKRKSFFCYGLISQTDDNPLN